LKRKKKSRNKCFCKQVGKDGERECYDVYPRCILDVSEMLEILRRQGISFEIPGEERDCQVYFLWKKKDKRIETARKKAKDILKDETVPSAEAIKFDDEGNSTENPTNEEK
jgi:hypothetical protein